MKINVIRSYIFPSMVSQCRKRRNGKVVKFHLSPRYKDHTNMSSFFIPLFQHWYISTNDQLISPRPVACIYHQQTIDRWIFPSLSLSRCVLPPFVRFTILALRPLWVSAECKMCIRSTKMDLFSLKYFALLSRSKNSSSVLIFLSLYLSSPEKIFLRNFEIRNFALYVYR